MGKDGGLTETRPPSGVVFIRVAGGVKGMGIDEIAAFGEVLKVLDNRMKVINHMLGYAVVGCADNPMRMRLVSAWYLIEIDGCEMDRFRVYDTSGARRVLERIEGMNDGIWLALRQGLLRVA